MHFPMNPLPMRQDAAHFMQVTLVRAMQGVLFGLISALFALAGAVVLLQDSAASGGSHEVTALAAAAPALAATPEHCPVRC
jgi:hypothetical protein